MKRSPTLRWPWLLVLLFAFPGCGGDDKPTEPSGGLDSGPTHDTPLNTMILFERTYENQVLDLYVALLAADFRYEFSAQADPSLVSQFGTSWGVSNDSASTAHLFDGSTGEGGDLVPGAAGITLSLPGMQIIDDPDHPDSAAYYKLAIVPALSLLLDVPGTDGFEISAPFSFHLVRGDAAVLRVGQAATSNRWYVHRQKDLTPALARMPSPLAPSRVLPASPSTWGRIKADYL